MNKFLAAALTILLAVVFSFAQTTTGQLTGTVSGPDGVLPGATITATDNKTGKAVTVTADEEGGFRFQQLEFGTYTVVVTANGFKTFTANELKIDVGREYKLEPRLEVGSVQENVTITAGADVVTATTAQISNTVSPQQILSLPLVTRNPLALTGLQAGVSANSAQVTTINGMRTTFTNITRDGINIQDNFIRTNATDFAPGRPSVDDTGEFTITTTNSEADQGYGGAQIRLVTPRGTRDFHGALFAYNRNSKFAANNFFNNRSPNPSISEKPPFRNRNQYGGKLSGPLWVLGFGEGVPTVYKDKGFFFFAYEGIKDPQSTATNGTRTILTPSARNGAFVYNRTNSTDVTPFCPSQTIGTVCTIPNLLAYVRSLGGAFSNLPTSIDPVILNRVISQLPTTSNFTGGDAVNGVGNTAGYRLVRRSDQTRDQYSSRIDVDIDEKNTFHGIFNYNKELNLRPDADTTKFTVVPGVEQFSTNKQFTMAYRRIISSNFVNEIRGGVFTSEVPFDRTDAVPDLYFGSGTLNNTIATSAGIVSNPENTFMTQGRNTKTFNIQDNADYVWGKHTFRFGGQSQIFRVNSYNDALIVPIASLGTAGTPFALTTTNIGSIGGINGTQLGTANGLLALFGGIINQRQQSFNIGDLSRGFEPGVRQFQPFRFENHSLYFSDRWSVTRDLTLTLGVRYELFPALRLNNSLAFEPVLDENDVIGSLVSRAGQTQILGGNAGRRNAYYKTDYNNFAPNIGFAWAPSFEKGVLGYLLGQNKTVIRGGYSQIFGNDSIVTSINNAGVGTPGLARTTVTEAISAFAQNGIGTVPPPAFTAPPRSYLFNNGQQNNFATVFGIDPNLETPMIEQYSFGIQREFFGNTALEVRYVGSRSKNLVRGIDLNQIDIFGNGFLADFMRAQQNFAASRAINPATATPFCGVTGSAPNCTPLTIFQNGGAIAPGRLPVGTNGTQGVSLTTFITNIQNGTPADLALAFVNSAANLNNHPCAGPRPVTIPAQPACNPNATPSIPFLRNPAAGAIDLMLNDANYNYNSLQVEVRRRFANGLYFQANYTFSKNLTNAIGTSQQLFEPYLDNERPELDYQRADFDQTHVFNFNGIYQLPFGKGKMFLNQGGIVDKVFGGWEVSGLGTWTSGAPITFVDTRGTFNRTGRSARQTPFSNLTNDQIRALGGVFEQNGNIYFINPSILNTAGQASPGYISPVNANSTFQGQVFFSNAPGQTGNVARALVNGPKFFNVNMALLKNIRFTETMRLQLRGEAFNVFNNVNFNISAAQQLSSITSTSFGQLTATANAARELQFAIRFEF